MIYYYSLYSLFVIISIMMVIDPNVSEYIVLLSKIVKVNIERFYFMIRFHPFMYSSPIGKWWMMRKYMKIIKELSKELDQNITGD